MRRSLVLGCMGLLVVAAGCAVQDGKNSRSKGEANAPDEAMDESGKKSKLPVVAVKSTGKSDDADSPDSRFMAENYIRDLLETDDAEAFGEELRKDELSGAAAGLALVGDLASGDVAPQAPSKPAASGASVSATSNIDLNIALAPPGDADPTENVHQLFELSVETAMSLADKDADGFLNEKEFTEAVFFPELKLSAEVMASIQLRRASWFEKIKGDDEVVSGDELRKFFAAGKKYVNKLRKLRHLPYAGHLAKGWHEVKVSFDANGDGTLDETELAALREARAKITLGRRAHALAAEYRVCAKFVEEKGILPPWFDEHEKRWGKLLDVKIAMNEKNAFKPLPKDPLQAEKFMDTITQKLKSLASAGVDIHAGGSINILALPGAGLLLSDATATGTSTGKTSEQVDLEAIAAEVDPCQAVLDRAASFGLSKEVIALLEAKGLWKKTASAP